MALIDQITGKLLQQLGGGTSSSSGSSTIAGKGVGASFGGAAVNLSLSVNSLQKAFEDSALRLNTPSAAVAASTEILSDLLGLTDRLVKLAKVASSDNASTEDRASANTRFQATVTKFRQLLDKSATGGIDLRDKTDLAELLKSAGVDPEGATELARFFNTIAPLDGELGYSKIKGEDVIVSKVVTTTTFTAAGAGTLRTPTSFATAAGAAFDLDYSDFNRDGNIDILTTSISSHAIFASSGNGDGTFNAAVSYATANGAAYNSALGDINGDGVTDVLTDVLGIAVSNGDGSFVAPVTYTITAAPTAFTSGDYNQDGVLDVVTGYSGATGFSVLIGNTDGSFKAEVTYPQAGGFGQVRALSSADFDRDGILDLLVTGDQANVQLLRGNADGSFRAGITSAIDEASGAYYVSVADVNSDGKLDLVHSAAADTKVYVSLGDGAGNFAAAVSYDGSGGGESASSVTLSDVNGDGRQDVLFGTSGATSSVRVLLGNADGSFQANVSYGSFALSSVVKTATADINHDGKLDIVAAANGSGQKLEVFYGNGNGTFQAAQSFTSGNNILDFAVLDHNGDGSLDVVTATDSGVSLILGSTTTTFANPVTYAGGPSNVGLAVSDMNRDGQTDVIVGSNATGVGSVRVLLGNAFTRAGTFKGDIDYTEVTGANDLYLSDVNGDGIQDALFSNFSNKRYYVALGNADGSFSSASARNAPEVQTASQIGDINGDGKVDLVLLVDNGGGFSLNPYLGTGAGTFVAGGSYAAINGNSVALGDVNRDGKLDIVTGDVGASTNIYLGNGDGSFNASISYATSGLTRVVKLADVNHDGILDLAAGTEDTRLDLRLGNGDGTFRVNVALQDVDIASDLVFADLNADGDLDIAAASETNGKVAVFIGNGDGTFLRSVTYVAGTSPSKINTADINRDGKLDILVDNKGDGNIGVLYGNGDGTFQAQRTTLIGPNSNAFQLADLDRNGQLDIVSISKTTGKLSVNLAGAPNEINIFTGVGDGTFNAATTLSVGYGSAITLADIDKDGKLDIFTNDNQAGTTSVYLGNGNGTFRAAISSSIGYWSLNGALQDFNRDGKLDYVASANNSIFVALGNGNGTFLVAKSYAATSSFAVGVGDVNKDGILDTVVGASGGLVSFNVLLGNSNGSFNASVGYGSSPELFANVVDFNGDGNLDVVGGSGSGNTLDVYLGNGDGTFRARTSYTADDPLPVNLADFNGDGALDAISGSGLNGNVSLYLGNSIGYTGSFQNRISSAAASTVTDFLSADMNGDGKLDIVSADGGNSTVSISLGNGDGTFQARVSYSTTLSAGGLSVGDFDGNGTIDVAAGIGGATKIFLGNSNGTLLAPVSYAAGVSNGSLKSADVSGDGKLDILTFDSSSGKFYAVLGNGNGTFKAPVSYSTGVTTGPGDLTLADVNGDGKFDAISSSTTGANIGVALGNGDGTFNAPISYTSSGTVTGIALKDLNGDAYLDIVATNSTQDKVSILLGNSDGTFKASVSYFGGDTPNDVALADTNADGIVDILTAGTGDSRYNVLLGNGDGTFTAEVSYYGGIGSNYVRFADLDRDGRPDILGYSNLSSTYDVLLSPGDSGTTVTTIGLEVALAGASTDPLTQNLQTKGGATIAYNTLTKLQKDVLADAKGIQGILGEVRGALLFAAAGTKATLQASDRITSYNNANQLAQDLSSRIRGLAHDPYIGRHSILDRTLVAQLLKD